jgi:phosphinothricin acetyltransferase
MPDVGAGSIRLATAGDATTIARIYAPYVADSPTSFETEVPDASEVARRINDTLVSHPWLVYEEADAVGGYAYATKHRVRAAYQWSVEVSVYVDDRFRRRRIAQALYTSLFRLLALQGFVNAYAGITLPNAASVKLHESMGFESVGVYRRIGFKHGAWHDVGWWERAVAPYDDSPRPPRLLADVIGSRSFGLAMGEGVSLVRSR